MQTKGVVTRYVTRISMLKFDRGNKIKKQKKGSREKEERRGVLGVCLGGAGY